MFPMNPIATVTRPRLSLFPGLDPRVADRLRAIQKARIIDELRAVVRAAEKLGGRS